MMDPSSSWAAKWQSQENKCGIYALSETDQQQQNEAPLSHGQTSADSNVCTQTVVFGGIIVFLLSVILHFIRDFISFPRSK